MVTAPVHKGVINDAGIAFTGHTEYLADKAGCDVVMMLAAGGLRVALATTHLALSAVPAAITIPLLTTVLRIIDSDLRRSFGIARPRILMAGLNPHSGEGGHLGREDIEVLQPALQQVRAARFNFGRSENRSPAQRRTFELTDAAGRPRGSRVLYFAASRVADGPPLTASPNRA